VLIFVSLCPVRCEKYLRQRYSYTSLEWVTSALGLLQGHTGSLALFNFKRTVQLRPFDHFCIDHASLSRPDQYCLAPSTGSIHSSSLPYNLFPMTLTFSLQYLEFRLPSPHLNSVLQQVPDRPEKFFPQPKSPTYD